MKRQTIRKRKKERKNERKKATVEPWGKPSDKGSELTNIDGNTPITKIRGETNPELPRKHRFCLFTEQCGQLFLPERVSVPHFQLPSETLKRDLSLECFSIQTKRCKGGGGVEERYSFIAEISPSMPCKFDSFSQR